MKDIILSLQSRDAVINFINELTEDVQIKATQETLDKYGCNTIEELQKYDAERGIYDCGWFLWKFADEELHNHMGKLSKADLGYVLHEFRLASLPIQGTGTKIHYSGVIEDYLNEIGIPIACNIHLD